MACPGRALRSESRQPPALPAAGLVRPRRADVRARAASPWPQLREQLHECWNHRRREWLPCPRCLSCPSGIAMRSAERPRAGRGTAGHPFPVAAQSGAALNAWPPCRARVRQAPGALAVTNSCSKQPRQVPGPLRGQAQTLRGGSALSPRPNAYRGRPIFFTTTGAQTSWLGPAADTS